MKEHPEHPILLIFQRFKCLKCPEESDPRLAVAKCRLEGELIHRKKKIHRDKTILGHSKGTIGAISIQKKIIVLSQKHGTIVLVRVLPDGFPWVLSILITKKESLAIIVVVVMIKAHQDVLPSIATRIRDAFRFLRVVERITMDIDVAINQLVILDVENVTNVVNVLNLVQGFMSVAIRRQSLKL
ncbi:hypothetical protein Glove_551g59 [Diversispora epigaea]|uniref:Uncharacterized protein n=1 Tax=Diversispora epigaea TaxID=1348612 RepID=A0A397GF10_9GLOM|nr:hypothetical protein Glove_551g59 [Diversispora epigaea]